MAKPAQTPSQVPNPNPCLQVIAVFNKIGVKVDLFSMVFGESVLNDAVAIVLSTTLLTFNTPGAQVDVDTASIMR